METAEMRRGVRMAEPQTLEEARRIAKRAMNHILYITGRYDTTANPEYPLGQEVTADASKLMAPREVKRCAATQRQDVLGSDRPPVIKNKSCVSDSEYGKRQRISARRGEISVKKQCCPGKT
ncbi:hypothetical protein T4B_12882 [Trichinella pseudospiralis]|uniref:Uncharacterized protein n=1 Tax=Trichinella pseudospiralis TaxID=6337 RepID=A0A0V1JHT1_TRIPS|nr:hypothetical protein T4B_12882 [Trichinella pseudospiralis]KRZ34413.1 hypothetical protein T4C_1948 [Trichinella pseudospiralis]